MTSAKGGALPSFLNDPFEYPRTLDEKSGEIVFIPTARRTLSRATFLDGREEIQTSPGETRIPLTAIKETLGERGKTNRDWNFIFHTGFCCSTLISRCLDRKGVTLSLKEPGILNPFSHRKNFLTFEGEIKNFRDDLGLCIDLLARKPSSGENVLIKPSNIDSVLVDDVVALNPDAKVVFLHSDLMSFLIAVAKGGQPRRDFIRRLLAHLISDLKTRHGFSQFIYGARETGLWNLSDLHIAAAAWHLQMNLMKETGPENALWLDCEEFLTDPEATLAKLDRFFGFEVSPRQAWKPHLEKVMSQHAKALNFSFGPEKRKGEFKAIEAYLERSLKEVTVWADRTFSSFGCFDGEQVAV